MSFVKGKPYYYSFDLSCVPSLYEFVQRDESDPDDCKHKDACVKCKVVEVTNNKNHWIDSPYAFFNRQTNDYKHSYFLMNYDKKILKKRILFEIHRFLLESLVFFKFLIQTKL